MYIVFSRASKLISILLSFLFPIFSKFSVYHYPTLPTWIRHCSFDVVVASLDTDPACYVFFYIKKSLLEVIHPFVTIFEKSELRETSKNWLKR